MGVVVLIVSCIAFGLEGCVDDWLWQDIDDYAPPQPRYKEDEPYQGRVHFLFSALIVAGTDLDMKDHPKALCAELLPIGRERLLVMLAKQVSDHYTACRFISPSESLPEKFHGLHCDHYWSNLSDLERSKACYTTAATMIDECQQLMH